ncbi:MAG: YfbK domain-containing protein [Bacteroidota bacterium]
MMVDQFTKNDRIAIVTYAGKDKVVLNATRGDEKRKIKKAIDKLKSGGGTAGAKGIITAYDIAEKNFIEGGNNRIILATDGDFNIGLSSQEDLVNLIEDKRESGVFLTVVGAGAYNYNEAAMEQVANHGNGTYEYIDSETQGRKIFVDEYGKFFAKAKDVKVQVEFNQDVVNEYRLIGYENRKLATEDFEDDTKDAGEISAGQNVTALYEIIPVSTGQKNANAFTIDFRYKQPDNDVSIPLQLEIPDASTPFDQASEHQRFVSSVAAFGMLLRESKYSGTATYDSVLEWASKCTDYDPYDYRKDLQEVILAAKSL